MLLWLRVPRSSPGSVCYSGFHYGWRKRRPAVLRIKNNLHKKLPMELFLSGVFLWLSPAVTRHRAEVNSPRDQRRFSSELKRTEQRGERNWAASWRRLSSETKEIGQRDGKAPMKVCQKSIVTKLSSFRKEENRDRIDFLVTPTLVLLTPLHEFS